MQCRGRRTGITRIGLGGRRIRLLGRLGRGRAPGYCYYLFHHTPAMRIQAGTHAENPAEQKSLEKAGFRLEGVVRACEFRAGEWRDGYLYSCLRTDPAPDTN